MQQNISCGFQKTTAELFDSDFKVQWSYFRAALLPLNAIEYCVFQNSYLCLALIDRDVLLSIQLFRERLSVTLDQAQF